MFCGSRIWKLINAIKWHILYSFAKQTGTRVFESSFIWQACGLHLAESNDYHFWDLPQSINIENGIEPSCSPRQTLPIHRSWLFYSEFWITWSQPPKDENKLRIYISELICVCKWTQTLAGNLSSRNDAKTLPWNAGNICQFWDIVFPDTEVKRKVMV